MEKIKGSHYFLIFLGAAIALNIFTNIASAFGIIPTPGPIIQAILWSSLTATVVALIIAYMQGVFVKEANHAKKKTAGLSNAFYGFFITATILMIVNLFGEDQFMNTCYAILVISGIAFVVNLLLPEVFLYLNRLGDSHKDDLDKKITKKKVAKTADPDEKKDEEPPKTNWVKIAIVIIPLFVLMTQCR